MDLDDYLKYKAALERHQREHDRAQGRLEALLQRLQEDFACNSLAAARKLLAKKAKRAKDLAHRYQELLVEFDQAYSERMAS